MSDTSQTGVMRASGTISDTEVGAVKRTSEGGDATATSGAVSRASGDTNAIAAPTTTISTIAVQSGDTRIVLALLQSGEWLELRVVELSPGLVYLGSTLEEASALSNAHHEVLTKLQSKQSPVEDLLNQADQLISTQRPRAEVYAAMAESLGLAWRDLNSHLETRKNLLDLSVTFHTRARQYSDAMDAAEKVYTDNVMPTDVETAKCLLTSLHDHKRAILEASMYTLQEAHVLLGRLKGLLQEGGSMDSRPQHIRTNIEFACSQIEHYLESLHDRRRFLDGLYIARKHHLEQCLTLCVLYQDLTEAILNLKKLRDDISEHQDLGSSQANAEILLHEHLRRENAAKAQQDQCVRHVRTAEQMVASGHYAGAEARARAYSVLEAATALHETCDTRTALLEQTALFFKLATGALTKLDQAEVQVAGMTAQGGGNQRLSVVMAVVEESIQPALAEGYALLEVTGGKGQPHNQGVTDMVEQLENRRIRLSSLCADSTEKVLQRTELINSFLEMYNAIESWLVKIGDSFLRGHQDPGGSLSLAKDFLHLHLTLRNDLVDKSQEIATVSAFLEQLSKELPEDEVSGYREKVEGIRNHWTSLNNILDSRIKLSEKYVRFHEDADKINTNFEELEILLKNAKTEADNVPIEDKWQRIQRMYQELDISGREFIKLAKGDEYPYLDVNRAILCVEYILENLGKRKLVVTDLFTHYQMKITTHKELITLWNTYKENIKKMEIEIQNLEDCLCPLLRGDPSEPENIATELESRLAIYVKSVRSIQEEIQNMVTKAEGLAHSDEAGAERPEIVRSLLQLYQNLQNKATDYQILGAMLIQWCKNISEVHRSCDKLEKQFGLVLPEISGVERQLRELEAAKHAVAELLKFAQHEADAIIHKIRIQCPREPGSKDIAKIKEMLERRRTVMEESWTERQILLEKQLKRSQYQTDLKVIRDQLRDLSDQLNRMKGHYGDSLNAALNMKTAFNQFKLTVEMLGRRIDNFVSTAEKMLTGDEDARTIQLELTDLQNKWSTFHTQVGESQKSINLSIEFFKLVQETELWFKEGSQLLVTVAGESSHIQNPEQARKLQQKIESFLTPGEIDQANRISKITSLAILLYGDITPQQVDAVSQQNKYMLDSFNSINRNLVTLMDNLKTAEEQRRNQEKEQQELAASLAQAQAEAGSARLAAIAAEEARRVAEETVTAMAMHRITTSETVEVIVQTEDLEPSPPLIEELPPVKKVKIVEELNLIPPMFLTPLVGATVTEGVKFTFECRVTGFPVPEVEWLKNGHSIMSNPDYRTSFDGNVCALTIEETFTEDSALYTCRAKNKCGTAESSANLIVKEAAPTEILSPPTFIKRLSDSSAQEGSTFQLEAKVTGHPLPVVSWNKNAVCIDNSSDYIITYNNGDCVLRFEELFQEDDAEYSCRATNDLGEDITKAKLTVLATLASEKPYFPVPLSNLMARAGQKFKLECEVRGSPTLTLAWFHNNKQVKQTPDCKMTFDGKTASLIIFESFPKNAGKYTLVAKNTAGEAQTSSNVSVKGRIPAETSDSEIASDVDVEPIKPSVQQALKDVFAKEGDKIRLDCIIIGQPEPEVIWYHDEKPVKESEDIRLLFHGDRCSLVIEEAYVEDVGQYKVVAMNSAGEASTACNVNVEVVEKAPVLPLLEIPVVPPAPATEPPRFSRLLLDTHVVEGESVILKASVSGLPIPTIAWFRDGVPLLPDDQLQIYEEPDGFVKIYVPRTNLDHTGQYEVVASNSVGTAKCICFLSIEPRLPSPIPTEPQEPPGFTKLLDDVTIDSGHFLTLEAEVTGKPKPSIYWTLNESKVDEFEYLHGVRQYSFAETEPGRHSFKITTVSRAQDGRVTIVAENEVGRAVSACNLHVFDPPVPVTPPPSDTFERRTVVTETHVSKFISSSTTDEGPVQQSFESSTASHISKISGQPTLEVHGSRIQEVKQEGFSEPQVSEKVSVVKLQGDRVVEEISTDLSTVTELPRKKLVIKRKATPARFITPLQGVILKENEKAVFDCVIDGYPEPSIKWTHNGNPLGEDIVVTEEGNRLSLVIPKVAQRHSGRYTCSLDNEAGSAQCTCDLVVRKIQFPPVFSKRLQPSVIGVGERLHLEIDVSGTPTPEITWSKNGQPLQSSEVLTIKTEGTRSWLVIQDAKESDSGRYGVVASNGAGRAECLADVMVTSLAISEPTNIITFTDISDDSRSQVFVEAERVKTVKKIIESSSLDTQSHLIPVSLSINTNPPEQRLSPDPTQSIPELPEVKEERKPPGKLRLSWPPQEPEEEIKQKLDIEITKSKVSDIISSFNTLPETEPTSEKGNTVYFEKVDTKVWEPSLVREPEPQYGYIETQQFEENLLVLDQEIEQEKSITPEFNLDHNIPSSSEFETLDGELSDNILSTPATSDYYPKTSPSVEVEYLEKFQQISEEPEILREESEIPEVEGEEMEVKTERHSRESSFTEIKKSVSSTEKTIVETRVYRDYPKDEITADIRTSPVLHKEEVVEYVSPATTEVIEHKSVPILEQDGFEYHEAPVSSQHDTKTHISHEYTSSDKTSSFSAQEAHASYISSTQVETKYYPPQDSPKSQDIFEISGSKYIEVEKSLSNDATSGDEQSKSPLPGENKIKKKRESVKQIALRLVESITPMSPEEVPGGIRMFPPKPATPAVEGPQQLLSNDSKIEEESIDEKVKITFSEFPKLEPFPFTVDERPKVEKLKGPPPAMPKKFIPGTFTDSECESDLDITIGEKFVPKKIHFEAKSATRTRSSSEAEPPPPSAFDKPPVIEGMRPDIFKKEEIIPEVKPPKDEIPKRKPKIVENFLSKAGERAELEITHPKPPSLSSPKIELKKEDFSEAKRSKELFITKSIVSESQVISEATKPVPKKLEKIWPPPQEPIVSPAIMEIELLKFIGEEPELVSTNISRENEIVKESTEVYSQQSVNIIQERDVEVKPVFIIPVEEIPQTPPNFSQHQSTSEITAPSSAVVFETKQSGILQTASSSVSGFKSVKAPILTQKKEKPASAPSPAPPFEMAPPVVSPILPVKVETKVSVVDTVNIITQEAKKDTQIKSFVSSKKQSKIWPPKTDESAKVITPIVDARSHSLERPPVTVAPTLPQYSFEAPPAIYWSSNITLNEKRHSLPLEYVDSSTVVSLSQESMSQKFKSSLESTSKSKTFTGIKQIKSSIAQKVVKSEPAKVVPVVSPAPATLTDEKTLKFDFKPMPSLEPFPFSIQESKERVRQHLPSPPKPSKFVPGSFTESDYESDNEGKLSSIWRPYMSDTEASYKPIKVKLKQGRQKRPKGPSPPAPSQFDIPPQITGSLRPAVSLSDLEDREPIKESEPLQMTTIQCKFTKKSSSKPKAPAVIKPVPIRPTSKNILSTPVTSVTANGPVKVPHIQPSAESQPPQTTSFAQVQEKSALSTETTAQTVPWIHAQPHAVTGVRSLKDKFQASSTSVAGTSTLKPQVRSSSLSSSPSPSRGITTSSYQHVSFTKQEQKLSAQKIASSSTPDLVSSEKVIPVAQEMLAPKLSPKFKKIDFETAVVRPKEFEESGYTADTESTLPRKQVKSLAVSETANASTNFTKNESHSASFSSFKSESKSFQSKQSSSEGTFNMPSRVGFGIGSSGGDQGGFPPGGGPPDSFSFPSHSFPTFNQSTGASSFYSSSESKSSQVKNQWFVSR